MKFFVEKHKFNFSGGWGLKKPKTTKIMPKLGHYLPFEKKSKNDFFVEKLKNLFLRGAKIKKKS